MSGLFNPEAFMNASIEGALDTKVTPCPVGEFHAISMKVEPKSGEISKGDRIGETWAMLEVTWEINDEEAKRVTGREIVRSKQAVMLDLTPEGMLDLGKGKNVRLGKLRDALGQNDPSVSWSPTMLLGQSAVVVVGHRPDPKDSSIVYDEVTGVRPA
jgi:hypothetical protein